MTRNSRALCYHLQALRVLQTFHQTTDSERLLHYLLPVYESLRLPELGIKCYEQALDIIKTFGTNPCEDAIAQYCGEDNAQFAED